MKILPDKILAVKRLSVIKEFLNSLNCLATQPLNSYFSERSEVFYG